MKNLFFHVAFIIMISSNFLFGFHEIEDKTQASIIEYEQELKEVVCELYDIGAIQFGSFKLKSGITSPYYIDLRRVISNPVLLTKMADLLWDKISSIECDEICAIPYASLSLTTAVSLQHNKPMLMLRKEPKDHGTKKLIEGIYKKQDEVLLVDDVLTSGDSIANAAQELKKNNLLVENAVVFLDREKDGKKRLESLDIKLHSVLSISKLFSLLEQSNRISKSSFVEDNLQHEQLSYSKRAETAPHPLARNLFYLMEEKQTNLAASADITDKQQLLLFADMVGPYICVLKTHVDIIEDFDNKFILDLQKLAEKHRFYIFEDRKFADIGNTVASQYEGGIYKIASWANLINAHSLPGQGLIDGLKKVNNPSNSALILISQMSCANNLFDNIYSQKTLKLASENKDFVIGFIAKERLDNDSNFIYFTPGIHLQAQTDALQQKYQTPYEAITCRGSDIIIVGRGLYKAKDPALAAEQYRSAGWDAYLQRLSNNK